MTALTTTLGKITLKNPLIAGSAEHLIEADGVRRALKAGVGGFWNLPLTCQWLALSRTKVGAERPLIGTNGAQNGLDVARMMLAGASAVEMSSAVMIRGADTLARALAEFEDYLKRKGLNAADLIGVAADRRRTFPAMPLKTDNWKKYVST